MPAISQRMHLVLLTAWTVLWFAVVEPNGGFSWHYLRTGGELIYQGAAGDGTGGLNLYAHHPELQMGPVSFLVAGLFNPFPEATGQFLAAALMALLGLVIVVLAGRSAAHHFLGTGTNHQRLRQRVLIAGLAFLPMWIEVAVRFGHLDDVLALFFTALAVRSVTRGNAALTGVFLALAMDSKPTALAFIPLLLALPKEKWLRAAPVVRGAGRPRLAPVLPRRPAVLRRGEVRHPQSSGVRTALARRRRPADPRPGTGPRRPPWGWRSALSPSGAAAGPRWSCSAPTPASSSTPASTPTTPPRCCSARCCGTSSASGELVPWWSWLALLILYGSVFAVPDDAARGLIRLAFVAVSTAYVLLWPVRERGGRGRGRPQAPRP